MAMIQSGSNSAGYANVDSNYNAQVNLPGNTATGGVQGGGPEAAGFATMLSEVDAGTVTGERLVRAPEVSQDYRQRVGMDTLLFSDTFNASAQNTSCWSYTFATMTAAQPGAGTVNFGTVQGTTSAHGAFMRTFQHFPLFGTFPLAVEFHVGQFTAALTAGEVWRMGLGLPSAATTPATDGVWIEITSAGDGSLLFNGTSHFMRAVFTFSQPATVCVLANPITWTTGDRLWNAAGFSAGPRVAQVTSSALMQYACDTGSSTISASLGAYHAFVTVANGASNVMRVDNSEVTGGTGTVALDGITLCAGAGGGANFGNFEVKEMVVFPFALDAQQRLLMQRYLARVGGLSA